MCKAFRALGHEAYSCDIQEESGGHPEWHILGDVVPYINGDCTFTTRGGQSTHIDGAWDLLIAHPPCTYLSNAGARWLYKGGKINSARYELGLAAKDFFLMFLHAQCNYIAVENPIPSTVFNLPNYSQIIQPYEHGEPWSKKTCLWLKNLPIIYPTNMVENYRSFCTSGSYSKLHDQKYKGASRKGGSAKSRSKTFPGIARAFAEQWSDYILKQNAGD